MSQNLANPNFATSDHWLNGLIQVPYDTLDDSTTLNHISMTHCGHPYTC